MFTLGLPQTFALVAEWILWIFAAFFSAGFGWALGQKIAGKL